METLHSRFYSSNYGSNFCEEAIVCCSGHLPWSVWAPNKGLKGLCGKGDHDACGSILLDQCVNPGCSSCMNVLPGLSHGGSLISLPPSKESEGPGRLSKALQKQGCGSRTGLNPSHRPPHHCKCIM